MQPPSTSRGEEIPRPCHIRPWDSVCQSTPRSSLFAGELWQCAGLQFGHEFSAAQTAMPCSLPSKSHPGLLLFRSIFLCFLENLMSCFGCSAIQKLVCSLVTTDVRLTSIRCTSVLLWVQFMSAPAMTAAMQCTPVVAVVHSGGRCGIAQWLASSLVMQLGDVPGAVS